MAAALMVGAVWSICAVTMLLGALTLPAVSVTVCAVDEPLALSSWSAGHMPAGMPELLSAQVKCTVTLPVYQPAVLGAVVAAALRIGVVWSIWTVTLLLGALTLPAASVTVCAVDEPLALSTWSAGHAPAGMPEPLSAQVKWTVTLPVYQPDALGAVVAAALMVGAVWSIWTVTLLLGALTLPAASVTVCAVDEPLALSTWSAGHAPAGMPDPLSAQVK